MIEVLPKPQTATRRKPVDRLGTGLAMYAARPLVFVTGSRYVSNVTSVHPILREVFRELLQESPEMPPILIHGNHRHGVDKMTEQWGVAQPRRVVAWIEHFDANFARYGNEAGPYRNGAMVERSLVQQIAGGHVVVLGFPAGNSSGAHGALDMAKRAGIRDIRVTDLSREIARHLSPGKRTGVSNQEEN